MESSCEEVLCEDGQLIPRARVEKAKGIGSNGHTLTIEELHEAQKPLIHFGLIASGDVVMKSGLHRDQIASCEKVIAFEMEGAGVWDNFPTVVIKSVCDYADSHKNKKWQRYAAATAAACMKAFLEEWRTADRPLEMSNILGKKVTGSLLLV
jgi:nucleoside phosphorylase